MDFIKDIVNTVTNPTVMFTLILLSFFFIFPPTKWFMKWNKRLKIRRMWTYTGGLIIILFMVIFFPFWYN